MTDGGAGGSSEVGAGGDPGTQPCRACRHPMPGGANKCTKCGSVQDWQRFLGFSGTILGLLVALISVLTFAIPIWTQVIVPKVARPSAVLVEVDDSGLATFAVSNGGTAPAAVEQIIVGRGGAVAMFDLTALSAGDRVIQPNDVRIFSARLLVRNDALEVGDLLTMIRSDSKCPAVIGVVTPAGSRDSAPVTTTTPGDDSPGRPGCEFKLRKLFVTTLVRRCGDPAFAAALLAFAAAHPADPRASVHCPRRAAAAPTRP